VAFEVARRLGDVEIVSVDSMQVYRGMDIGTAKPTLAEQATVPHHLLDLADAAEEWSVSRFQEAARDVLAGIEERGQRALLVGGTGLYLQAVIDGLELPGQWPAVRSVLEQEADDLGVEPLHQRLTSLDPLAAARMLPTNRRRILRALEVCLGAGRPFSSFGPGLAAYPDTAFDLVGMDLPRSVLDARIAARYESQMEAGFLEEVTGLAQRPQGLSRTARQALGYRELLAHLEAAMPLDMALEEAVRRTRAFARRQQSWFRRDPRIRWLTSQPGLTVEPGLSCNPLAVVAGLLGDWGR
jgi:tRNA dimethylallyltransferase